MPKPRLTPIPCKECGTAFKPKGAGARYCSKSCGAKAREGRGGSTDINQPEIVAAFIAAGCSVWSLHGVGSGVPDLCVGIYGQNVLVEVKNPDNDYGRRGLSPRQKRWAEEWKGSPVCIVRTVEDVGRLLQAHKEPDERGGAA